MKKFLIVFLTVAMITAVVPSFNNDFSMINEVEAKTKIKLNKTKITLVKGKSTTLKVIGTKKKAKWSTSNKKIAIVNSKGKVTAKKKGTVTITAKIGSKKYKCKIIVKNPIKLNKTKVTLVKGKSTTLKVTGTKKKVTWSSSNKKVATVNSKGKVTAKKKGIAYITAKADGLTVKSKITVQNKKSIPVEGLLIEFDSVSLKVGNTHKIDVIILPTNATNKTLTYTTSNKNVVTVDSKGKVTAKGKGKAYVTVKSSNGKKARCEFTVKGVKVEVSSVTLNKSTLSLNVGDTYQLSATVNPNNATNKSIEWQSSNESVVTVDSKGKVTAKKKGSAYIHAIAYGGKSKSCQVTVNGVTSNEEQGTEIAVNNITLSSTTLQLNEYETTKLTASVLPTNATNKDVKWKSSDSSVASVSSTGNVAAKKAGSATITASTSNNKTATCKVTVTKNQPKYKYDMEFLNEHGFYSGLDVIVHIKTNNPYPWYGTYDNFDTSKINVSVYSLDGERISGCGRAMSFADVHYIVDDTYNMHQCKVKDGFLVSISVDKAGTYEIRVEEDIPNSTGVTNPTYYNSNKKIQVCSKQITVLDYEKEENKYLDSLIESVKSEKTDYDKLRQLEDIISLRDYRYYATGDDDLLNSSIKTTPYWISRQLECISSTSLMRKIARKMNYSSAYVFSGQFGIGASSHHQALIDINKDGRYTLDNSEEISENGLVTVKKYNDLDEKEIFDASPLIKADHTNFTYIDENW